MARINILPQAVYNRIAAGEVIEKPYSVVKELVENAIDAGATEIEVFVDGGGTQLIRVVDNGSGIDRSDLHSAFLPHATSKIAKVQDLENILTLGFRGEAVASIASVSRMSITSKTEEGKCYRLTSEGGELGEIVEVSGEKGTEVTVENLFYNQPVRLKFLRSPRAEEAEITTFISRFILNRPDISFTYTLNGKRVLQSFGGGFEEAMVGVYGASVLTQCYQIDAEKNGIRLHGYIGNQNFYKANKSYQTVFLNGRFVQNATISTALAGAYSNYLMKRQYPFYVLHISVPTEVVDVNVHPNKSDVRFADNRIIYASIYSVINSILEGNAKALEYVVSSKEETTVACEEATVKEEKLAEDTIEQVDGLIKEDEWLQRKSLSQEILNEEKTVEKPQVVYVRSEESVFPNYKNPVKKNVPNIDFSKGIPPELAPLFQPIELTPEMIERGTRLNEDYEGIHVDPAEIIPSTLGMHQAPSQRVQDPEKLRLVFPKLPPVPTVTFKDAGVDENGKPKQEVMIKYEEDTRFREDIAFRAQQQVIPVAGYRYVGKMFNTYLMFERNYELYIIDQHAAHERFIYDKLKIALRNKKFSRQPMLIPYTIKVNSFEATFIRERMEDIRELGFDITEVNDTEFAVSCIPLELKSINLDVFFHDMLSEIKEYCKITAEDLLKEKVAMSACKAAVRAGKDLLLEEVRALFEMIKDNMGLKCPHGRPIVVKMTRRDLEKIFKRLG